MKELNELEKADDDEDWRASRRLVFHILRDLNEKVNALEKTQMQHALKMAGWSAVGGVFGGAIPLMLDLLKHVTFK